MIKRQSPDTPAAAKDWATVDYSFGVWACLASDKHHDASSGAVEGGVVGKGVGGAGA